MGKGMLVKTLSKKRGERIAVNRVKGKKPLFSGRSVNPDGEKPVGTKLKEPGTNR